MLSRVILCRSSQDEFFRPCQITSAQVLSTAERAAYPSIVTAQTRQECEAFPALRGTDTSAEVRA